MNNKTNITLIGMSGVGKSTFGREFAARNNWNFIDTDSLLEEKYDRKIQDVVDFLGVDKFKQAEKGVIVSLNDLDRTVISPGGSVVYTDESMQYLKSISKIIYLYSEPEILEKSLNIKNRGILGMPEKTFAEIYRERIPLYEKYADCKIEIDGKKMDAILAEINISL